MAKDFESLKQQALVIKNEVEDGANSSERIGGMFSDMLDYNEEKRKELEEKIGSQTVEVDTELNEDSQKPIANAPVAKGINEVKQQLSTQLPDIEEAKENAIAEIGNKESDAIQNFSEQRVTPGMLSPETIQIINASGGGTINNLPDGETLAEIEMAEGLKAIGIPNRQPDTNLGYVILKKNKSLIEQIKEENTIYEVRYAYDLGGETLSMPENCVLKFEGGIISNGTINGNKTSIVAPICKIFGDNLNFDICTNQGFNVEYIYAEWFGAKGNTAERKDEQNYSVWPADAAASSANQELPDCAPAFNRAFELANLISAPVKALGKDYAVKSTIHIYPDTTFITEERTVFCVYGTGTGNVIITQNEDTSEFTTEEVSESPFYLRGNQLISTDAMFIAFEVESCRTRIVGGGTISMTRAQFAIGLLIRQRDFETLDMSYFSPEINLRFVGGVYGEEAGTSLDSYGDGAPTDDSVNDTGKSIYYIDKSYLDSKKPGVVFARYKKANNATTWELSGNVYKRLCTDIRADIGEGGAGGRLIDPHMTIGCMYGFRGVELYSHDGGWFNISTWVGTISNKYGSNISIFTDGAIESHDFSGVSMQAGYINWDYRAFSAIKARNITLGAVSDLNMSSTDVEAAFYFGKFTENCVMTWIDDPKFVLDYGKNNSVGYGIDQRDRQSLMGTTWVNHFDKKYYSYNRFKHINEIKTIQELEENINSDITEPYEVYPYLFDGSNKTSVTAIDTDNNLYGLEFVYDSQSHIKRLSDDKVAYLEVDLYLKADSSYESGDFKILVGDVGWEGAQKNRIINLNRVYTYATTVDYYVQRIFIPLKADSTTRSRIAIFATKEISGAKLDIYNIKLWTRNFSDYNDGKGTDYSGAIQVYPVYSLRKDSQGNLQINTGDAQNLDFRILESKNFNNEIVIKTRLDANQPFSGSINPILDSEAEYELIDAEGKLNIRIANANQENQGKFPSGYKAFSIQSNEEVSDDYFFLLKLRKIYGITINSFCYINIANMINNGIVDLYLYKNTRLLHKDEEDISTICGKLKSLYVTSYYDKNVSPLVKVSTSSLSNIETFHCNKNINVYGNLCSLPQTIKEFYTEGGDGLYYSDEPNFFVWNENLKVLNIGNATLFTTEMIDAIIMDIANNTITEKGSIVITKAAGNRSTSSDSAVNSLETRGWTISVSM